MAIRSTLSFNQAKSISVRTYQLSCTPISMLSNYIPKYHPMSFQLIYNGNYVHINLNLEPLHAVIDEKLSSHRSFKDIGHASAYPILVWMRQQYPEEEHFMQPDSLAYSYSEVVQLESGTILLP